MLNKEAIEEFKQIYLEEQGIELADDVAMEKAQAVYGFFEAILAPSTVDSHSQNRLNEDKRA